MKQWSHQAARLEPPLDWTAKDYVRVFTEWLDDPYQGANLPNYEARLDALRRVLERCR
jgi:hypothetical protein